MILTCPACGTQYVVKDGAVPPGGRQVRCASCRHSWHQDPEAPGEMVLDDEVGASPGDRAGSTSEQPSGAVADERSEDDVTPVGDDPAEASDVRPSVDVHASLALDETDERSSAAVAQEDYDEFTPFAVGSDEPRGRGPAFAVLIALALIVLAASAFYYLAPAEWKARIGVAEAAATPLQLMMTHSDRQRLASGNELLAISGRVINPTEHQQSVPPITAQLRDGKGKLVYTWTIAPPAPSLKAGDSAPFYSAEVNVPAGGDELTVTLGAPKA